MKIKKNALILVLAMNVVVACVQKESNITKFNFDFEEVQNANPVEWGLSGETDCITGVDSVVVKSGKYAAFIDIPEGTINGFKAYVFTLPGNYDGERITLSGYVKTKDVSNGFAGLWMRIDPGVAFDNMQSRNITGTTDWTKYEITLTMNPAQTEKIVIGGLLSGQGKIWMDSLAVSIDGHDIQTLKPREKKSAYPALHDKEFDNGSKIVFPEVVDEQLTTNLELLGKMWGFLKYHHPEVGKGNYNWDYELFRILPDYLKVSSNEQRDKMLLNWIKKYGKVAPCTNCKETPEDAALKPDLAWITRSKINSKLQQEIENIYQNRHQGEHFYISMHAWIGNPSFEHEKAYTSMGYPDAGFRLLCLYRYWNMIQYFFPNRLLMDKEWNEVLKEYIPLFVEAENELAYELAALRLIGEVQDTHANLWGGGNRIHELRGQHYAPFQVRFIEKQLVVTDYYNPELIEKKDSPGVGDVITHINGKSVESIIDSLRIYYPASNEPTRLRNISADMLRSTQNKIEITYHSGRQSITRELKLYPQNQLNMYHWYKVNKDEKSYKLLSDNKIGYVTLANIKNEDVPEIKKIFKDTKGIIIDIRNYPSAFMPFLLGSFFVADAVQFATFTMGNVNNPGEFTFSEGPRIAKDSQSYKGKLIVLVNEITQSQAEYTAMAFKVGQNTTIVGSTTAGADGNVSRIQLPGGLSTMISGIGVYYPDRTNTQRIGIVPDVWVEPTIKGIRQGKDELMEKAIELINSSK